MKTSVYTSGSDGYHTYRIPALTVTRVGTLLAFIEGRRNSRSDAGDIDLLVKRSSDGGKTWSTQETVNGEPGEVTIGNPCPVVDMDTGIIWLALCRDNNDVLVTKSSDDGLSWSNPEQITEQVKRPSWEWYATGPGVGIQLQRGPHKGRLVIPCDHTEPDGYGCGAHVIYSDDNGNSWNVGEALQPGADENQVVELSDGSLMMNVRMQTHSEGLRGVALSRDGGVSWSDFRHDANLLCVKCQASIIGIGSDNGDGLVFTNASSEEASNPSYGRRSRMTVRKSIDGGRSWTVQKILHEGPAAYSCLGQLSDGSIGCLYEAGTESPYDQVVFERFTL